VSYPSELYGERSSVDQYTTLVCMQDFSSTRAYGNFLFVSVPINIKTFIMAIKKPGSIRLSGLWVAC
jgi:hypothetical protein